MIDMVITSDSVFGLGPLLLVSAGIVTTCFAVAVYRLYFHRLSNLPGSTFNKISSWPNWSVTASGSKHVELFRQHQKYGSVVRFGPNDVSINTATALQEIYGSRKANVIKSDWYSTVQLAEGGLPSTFSIRDRAQHAQKRRLLARAFSESAIRDTEPHILEQVQKWCSILGEGAAKGEWTEGRNMTTFSDYLTFDILSDLCFGKSFDVLEKEENRFVVQLIPSSTSAVYTIGYMPLKFMRKLLFASPLAPYLGGQIIRDQMRLKKFCFDSLTQRREAQNMGKSPGRRDFFHHLFLGKDPDTGEGYTNEGLLAETLLLVIAGSDTTSTTLAAAFFYLLRTSRVLERLTREVRALGNAQDICAANVTEAKMPYLRAVIDETLRIAPPVPGHIPREVLPGGAMIDGKLYPGGTVVGVSTYALHHNEEYFPDPFSFSPERWIVDPAGGVSNESVVRAQSAFCAFSIGIRGCLGKNMAYLEISLALTYLLWHYDIRLEKGDKTGEEGLEKTFGDRLGEYQLNDCFVAKNNGPIVEFRAGG